MYYYIYYGYMAGLTAYKLYEFWDIARNTYLTCRYTYKIVNGVFKRVKIVDISNSIKLEDHDQNWIKVDYPTNLPVS